MRNKKNRTTASSFKPQDLTAFIPGTTNRPGDQTTNPAKKGYKPAVHAVYIPDSPVVRPQLWRKTHRGRVKGSVQSKQISHRRFPAKLLRNSVQIKSDKNMTKAFAFARELVQIGTSKLTALVSLKHSHKLSTRESRKIFQMARNAEKPKG